MMYADRKQFKNADKIAKTTEGLCKTVREHTLELTVSRIADYLELETERAVSILHSLHNDPPKDHKEELPWIECGTNGGGEDVDRGDNTHINLAHSPGRRK